jgi:hypothetical protein
MAPETGAISTATPANVYVIDIAVLFVIFAARISPDRHFLGELYGPMLNRDVFRRCLAQD